MPLKYKKIVVKIGSNVLTQSNGLPDEHRIANLVEQIVNLKKQGISVIVISSGAVASGRSMFSISEKHDAVAARQLLASIGQIKLINNYMSLFQQHQMLCSQVLVTKEDFRDRKHYLNIKSCLNILLKNNVIPIVNENDVVSVTELMFTDNDELAALIASMLDADALIILSNVDGIYNGDPKSAHSALIPEVKKNMEEIDSFISTAKSGLGRGGMVTKLGMARKVAKLGIPVHITNGMRDNIVYDLLFGTALNTYFVPEKITSGKKKWIAHSEQSATGSVQLNAGAKTALISGAAHSLLPVGIIAVISAFEKGDIIKLVDEDHKLIGLGIADYNSEKAKERIGQKGHKALVHYNYFYAVD